MIFYRLEVKLCILCLMVSKYLCADVTSKGSLVFVIDKTLSMQPVIDTVKENALSIFDIVQNNKESPIENSVLVLFGDPDVSDPLITKNPEEFKERLASITLEDGGNCPEKSMTGIKTAIDASLPGCFVYVFTDAPADDYKKYKEVKFAAQKKNCQVVFVYTDNCPTYNTASNEFKVYTDLAEATFGQVFQLRENSVSKILNYVKSTITGRRIPFLREKFPAGARNFTIDADSKVKDLVASFSVDNSTAEAKFKVTITAPDGDPVDEDTIAEMGNILIISIPQSMPGQYKVELSSAHDTYVVVTGRSDVTFLHGFSTKPVYSLDDTEFNPIRATRNILTIKLIGENIDLKSVKFLTTSYVLIKEWPLHLLNRRQQLYATDFIYPPASKFRIAVKGIENNTTEIVRFGYLVLEMEQIVNKNPTITIKGANKIIVDYNENTNTSIKLQLNCTVEAYPRPYVAWRILGETRALTSDLGQSPPYDYHAVLTLDNPKKSMTYQCYSENRLGNDEKTVQVEVVPKILQIMIETPKDQQLSYGETVTLSCKTNPLLHAKVSWHYNPRKKHLLGKLIQMSPDNSTLTIIGERIEVEGLYACLIDYQNKTRVYKARVSFATETPVFEKPSEVQIYEEESKEVNIVCGLKNRKPGTKISWYHSLWIKSGFKEMKKYRNRESISIKYLNKNKTGLYKCVAKNHLKTSFRNFYLFLKRKPTVELSVKKKIIVLKKGEPFNISCAVDGDPNPNIVWLKDKKHFKTNTRKLWFKTVKENDNGDYECTANNLFGNATASVTIEVHYLELKLKPKNTKYIIKQNRRVTFHCLNYFRGFPNPSVEWTVTRMKDGVLSSEIISTSSNLRQIMSSDDTGNYTCVVTNASFKEYLMYELIVQFPPSIINKNSIFVGVRGDRFLKIHCDAIGNPKPKISWMNKGLPIAKEPNKLSYNDNWMLIENLDFTDNSATYVCKAQSDPFPGVADGPMSVEIYDFPPEKDIINTTTMLIEKGSYTKIKCFIETDKIDIVKWYKNNKLLGDDRVAQLYGAEYLDSGVYTCRVSKMGSQKTETANTEVKVGSKPVFYSAHDSTDIMRKYAREVVSLDCSSSGEPYPTVTWTHNGRTHRSTEMVLKFEMDLSLSGSWTCKVFNDFDTISKTFILRKKEYADCGLQIGKDDNNQPLMLTTRNSWPEYKTVRGITTVPKLNTVIFHCPSTFTKFRESTLTAVCFGETEFFVNDRIVNYVDIKCNEDIRPTYHEPKTYGKKTPCLGAKTVTAEVKYIKDGNDIPGIQYCYDDTDSYPFFAKYTMKYPAGYLPNNNNMWDDSKYDSYDCVDQSKKFDFATRKCCFAKRHLVNPKDLFPGTLQRAAYNRLNIVPHWSTCHSENWDILEDRIRALATDFKKELIIYSGISHNLSRKNKAGREIKLYLKKQTIPKFLWKVVQCKSTRSSLAIIQLNIPGLKPSDIYSGVLCTDICDKIPWLSGNNWKDEEKGYIFCCELRDFVKTFHLGKISFQKFYKILTNLN